MSRISRWGLNAWCAIGDPAALSALAEALKDAEVPRWDGTRSVGTEARRAIEAIQARRP